MKNQVFDIATVATVIAPVIKDIYQGAKGTISDSFIKWRVSAFPRKLARKFSSTNKVKTIWSPDKDVSLSSFYYPSRIKISKEKTKVASSISDLGESCIVIEGIVGHGKSILLRYLCVQELIGNGTNRIPVFLELRNLVPGRDLKFHIFKALEKLDIDVNEQLFDYLAGSGKLVLLLDAFDELDTNLINETVSTIEYLAEKYERLQIIVTSRPDNSIQSSRMFEVVKIVPLNEKDYEGFFKKLKIKPNQRQEIISAIKQSPANVAELISTPLMLTLLVLVYESEKQIPSELPEFFEKLFHVVFTRHDRLKAGFNREHHSGLSERQVQKLFEAFCFMTMQHGFSRTLDDHQFEEAFNHAQEYTVGCECELDKFKKDITKVSCLMLEEGFNLTTFLHKSIVEYYAASFVKSLTEAASEIFYTKVSNESEHVWPQVLSFLQKIDLYRYMKFYMLPTRQKMLSCMGLDMPPINKDDCLSVILKLHPSLGIMYVKQRFRDSSDTLDEYICESYGTFSVDPGGTGDLWFAFQTCIVRGVMLDHPNRFSIDEIMSSHSYFIKSESGFDGYIMPMEIFFENYSTDKLIKFVNEYVQSMHDDIKQAKAVIASEEKKSLIFEKMQN